MKTRRLLVDAVAVYRLTKLITDDSLTQPLRDRIIEAGYIGEGRGERAKASAQQRWGTDDWQEGDWQRVVEEDALPPKVAVLVTCRWCAGMWVSLGVVATRRLFPRAWPPLAEALAFSAGAALLAGLED